MSDDMTMLSFAMCTKILATGWRARQFRVYRFNQFAFDGDKVLELCFTAGAL